MNHTVLGFNKQKTNFEVIESEDIATAWLVMGNEQGINTVCHNIPNGTVATMFQGKDKKTVIELVSPNGDTITRTSGRVDAKRVMKQLKDMGIATYNIKKGGSKVKI